MAFSASELLELEWRAWYSLQAAEEIGLDDTAKKRSIWADLYRECEKRGLEDFTRR